MLATYGLNMFARLIGNSKLAVGVECEWLSVFKCYSCERLETCQGCEVAVRWTAFTRYLCECT